MGLWIGIGFLYLALLLAAGITSLRNGHWVMFIIGFFLPLFWVIGALIAPTEAASRPAPVGHGTG